MFNCLFTIKTELLPWTYNIFLFSNVGKGDFKLPNQY